MCGILALFHEHRSGNRFEKLNRRGPDMSGHFATESVWLGHTRLAIVGPEAGAQPIITANWVLVINGEIYNGSGPTDCYCVPELLDSLGPNAPVKMDGVFSFVAYNKHSKDIIVARDAVGVTPLYWGYQSTWALFCIIIGCNSGRCFGQSGTTRSQYLLQLV